MNFKKKQNVPFFALVIVGCFALTVGVARAQLDAEAARQLELLESGTIAERVAAVRWLGLNLIGEARDPIYRQMQALPRNAAHAEFFRTAEVMLPLLHRPRMLEFRSVDEVLDHLDDPEMHLRASAVRHLAYYAPEGAVDLVPPFLESPEDLVREEAVATLRHLGDRKHVERVLELLNDSGAAVRLRALEYLLDLDRPGLLQRLVVVAADPSPWIAQPAVRALQEHDHGPAAAAAILDRIRTEKAPEVLARYLEALARFESREGWPKRWPQDVRPLLTHEDGNVRQRAAVLTSEGDKDAARDVLVGLLNSEDGAERVAAAHALFQGGWSVDARTVERLLGDEIAAVRVAGLDLTERLTPSRRRALLLDVIKRHHEETDVLARALSSLASVGTSDDVEFLVARTESLTSEHVLINAALTMAILEQRWQTRTARDWFGRRLADPATGRAIRQAIVRALQVDGDVSFLPLLADELRAASIDDEAYAKALIDTISILVGRQVHGMDFAASEPP